MLSYLTIIFYLFCLILYAISFAIIIILFYFLYIFTTLPSFHLMEDQNIDGNLVISSDSKAAGFLWGKWGPTLFTFCFSLVLFFSYLHSSFKLVHFTSPPSFLFYFFFTLFMISYFIYLFIIIYKYLKWNKNKNFDR